MCITDYDQEPKLDRQCTCNVKLWRVRLTLYFLSYSNSLISFHSKKAFYGD
jgi:hypothetical protein